MGHPGSTYGVCLKEEHSFLYKIVVLSFCDTLYKEFSLFWDTLYQSVTYALNNMCTWFNLLRDTLYINCNLSCYTLYNKFHIFRDTL